jgi:Flp pilus assembly protein TadG
MKTKVASFFRRVFSDQHGQAMGLIVGGSGVFMLCVCGVAGFTIDVGRAYVVRNQLQNTVNAAGLAAAGYIYNNPSGALTTAQTEANTFITNNSNFITTNPNGVMQVLPYPTTTLVCRNSIQTLNWTCATNPVNNALLITDEVSINTTFMRLFGIKSLTVTAQATASMAFSQLWNIAVIEDLTGSMATTDSKCQSMSEFECTLNGLQGFLAAANPCPPGASSCTPANANLRVALFGFPNMIYSALPSVNACSGASYVEPQPFTILTLPLPTATSYVPLEYQYTIPLTATTHKTGILVASYELTYGASDADANGFVSDYYDPSTNSGLNPASSLVQGIGYTGTSGSKTGCMLLDPDENSLNGAVTPPAAGGPGVVGGSSADDHSATVPSPNGVIVNTTQVGEGTTYLASVIYAANSALIAEKNLMTSKGVTTQNAIIIQSDGGVNTQWIYFPQGLVTQNGPATYQYTTRAPWTGNFAGYNYPTPATIPTTSICSATPGTAGSLACPGGYSNLNTTPQTPLAYATAKIAANLSSPLAMAVGGVAVANTGLYPDFLDECQQTIAAGMYAKSVGTRVYSIAYGASTASECSTGGSAADFTDVTLRPLTDYSGQTLNVAFSSLGALTPCVEMEDTASDPKYFYSYYPSGAPNTCVDPNSDHTATSIVSIYQSIQATIGKPRLIPNTAN